jgi:phosphatidate cytidylyltransferase
MLKLRVLTALILIPLVLAAIFLMPSPWFMILLVFILMRGSEEYTRLAGLSGHKAQVPVLVLQGLIMLVLFRYRANLDSHILLLMSLACAAWLLMFIRLPLFRPDSKPDHAYRLISLLTAILSITTGWFALGWIRAQQPDGAWLVLLLLLIVWAADTGAYFAGKTFGKNKLAPNISPGKTREGLFGGLITAPLVALIAANLMPIASIEPARVVLLSLVTALVSVGGDLLVSLHKRTSGFKDSGNLLPGHGGVLDRVDSLIAAAPFFALGLLISGL